MRLQLIDAVMRNYANFKGRAGRREYWQLQLEILVMGIFLSFSQLFIGLFFLLLVIPSVAVSIRRLHDIGKSGWYYLISWIPLLGFIIMLIWMCKKGEDGANRYGINPLSKKMLQNSNISNIETGSL